MDPQSFSSENRSLSKKNIITVLVIAILFLAIPFGVRLVQQQQAIRSRAGSDPITFTGPGVNCDKDPCTTTSDTVQIELRAPVPTTTP